MLIFLFFFFFVSKIVCKYRVLSERLNEINKTSLGKESIKDFFYPLIIYSCYYISLRTDIDY